MYDEPEVMAAGVGLLAWGRVQWDGEHGLPGFEAW